MDQDRVTQEVEKLLPPEQAQRGRVNDQVERQQMQQRFSQMRQQRMQRQQQPDSGNAGGGDTGPTPPMMFGAAGQPAMPGGGGRGEGRGSRRSRSGEQVGAFGDRGPGDAGEAVAGNGRRGRAIRENPISPWEQYLRDFIREYKLDDPQQATAQSILREMQERRTAHEQTHRVDYENARKIEDAAEREKKLAELNQTVVRLFDELKSRLTRTLSSAQRQSMGTPSEASPLAATKPSSQPS
jgi:hypothetical protein